MEKKIKTTASEILAFLEEIKNRKPSIKSKKELAEYIKEQNKIEPGKFKFGFKEFFKTHKKKQDD